MKCSSRASWPMLVTTLLVAGIPRSAVSETVSAVDLAALAGGVPQEQPAIAFDGARHLLVWQESAVIWGAMLDDVGVVVKAPFAIAPPAFPVGLQAMPAVAASTTGQFLVAWAEDTGATGDWNVRAARISAAGDVLDAAGFDVSVVLVGGVPSPAPPPVPGAQLAPAVAAIGDEFLVVWEDHRDAVSAPDVFGSAVAADGTVLDQGGVAISLKAGAQQRPTVASNGAEHLVAWEDSSGVGTPDVYGVRVSATGAVGGELVISTAAGDQVRPAVAASEAGWAVAWADSRTGAGWNVMAARVNEVGVVDPSGILIAAVDAVSPLALASDGSGYLVVYERGVGAFARRLTASGLVGAELTIAAAGVVSPGQTVCASGYESYLEVHREGSSGVAQLAGSRVITAELLGVVVTGGGVVTSVPAAISCNPTCEAWLETGTSVTLTAAPDSSSTFAGWSGCPAATGASCPLTMLAPASVTASFALALPGAPGGLTYSGVGTTSLTLSWAPASNATGYELERAPDVGGAAGTFGLVVSGTGTSHFDSGLSSNTTYWYRVRATNAAGAGDYGSWITARTLPAMPGAPTVSDVTASSVTVSWTAPDGGADGYELERASASGTDWTRIATVTTPTHIDASVSPGTAYQYRVRATNVTGAGTYSSTVQVTTVLLAPASPAAPTYPVIGSSSVTVSWATVTGAESYDLEQGPTETGAWTVVAAGVTSTSYVDGTLSPATDYWYRVRAVNTGGASPYSAPSRVTTTPGVPGAPTFSNVSATSLTVTWPAVTGATSYKLERSTAGGAWVEIAAGLVSTSHAEPTLTANTSYAYRVRATNASGDGPYSSAESITTLTNPPGAPTFTAITTSTLTVSWQPPSGGAASYDLDRGTSATGGWTSLATGTTATSFADTGLAAGTTYWYRIRAANASGTSGYATSSVPTLPAAPGAPTFSNVSTTSLTVTWPAVAGATSYTLERSTAGGAWIVITAGLVSTSHAETTLTANTSYAYRVRATNASGDGVPSAEASVATLTNPPGTPTFTAITTSTLTVSWQPPSGGAASYDLERAASATGVWTPLAAGTAATSFADTGLAAGTTYWYRVRAANASGFSGYVTSSVPTVPAAPGAPTFSNVAATSLTVSWPAVTGATTYKLERAPDVSGVPGAWAQIAAPSTNTHPDSGRTANTVYWYRVRATNASGDGAYSPEASVATLANPPGAPTFTAITTSSLTVSWQPPSGGAASYDLERAASATGTWTPLATATTATSFADTGLTAGTTYWYRVRAANASGVSTAYATSSVPTLPAAPTAPTFSNVAATSLTVSWPAVTGAATYKLERAPDVSGVPGAWTQIAAPTTTSRSETGLTANTTYWYRVRATNASGDGAYSPQASVATLANPPGAPTFTAITTSTLTVSWQPPTGGAASYDLERATSATGTWTPLATATTATSFADTGLTAGTTYWYRVRAANASGVSTAYATSQVPTLPAAPGAPIFSNLATTSLTVSWPTVTGATTYTLERAPDVTGVPGAWDPIVATSTTSHGDSGLTANTVYWYRLRAGNVSGDGAYSPQSSAITLPNAPMMPTFSLVTSTSLVVSWVAPVQGATSYDVERALSVTGPWTQIATGVPGFSRADAGLTAGTSYVYRVRAANAAGSRGAWSVIASVTTLPAAPGAPTFSEVSTYSLTVQWTPIAGATTYHLERTVDVSGHPDDTAWEVVAAGLIEPWYNDALDAPSTTYWYRVRGANEDGHASEYGDYSPASSVTTLSNPPGAPTFSNVGVTSVTLTWTAPAGAAPSSYDLQRATSASGPWTSTTVAGQSYTDTGLLAGTTYWYRVAARNSSGQPGLYSISRSVTTLTAAPGAPTFSNVTATSVTVTWVAAAGATAYRLERSTATSNTWSSVGGGIFGVSYVDNVVTPNTTYWYRVSAVNSAGAPGPYSAPASVTTLPGAPGAPTFTNVAATALTVSWTAPAGGAASYRIERATSAGGPWTPIATGVAVLSHGDSGLLAGTTYHYRVLAVNSAGAAGLPSATRAITTTADVTTAPGAIAAAPSVTSVAATSVRLSWSEATNAASYELERALGAGAWARIAVLAGTTFADTGRSANTLYRYRVRGVNAFGEGPYSPEASVITAPNAPAAPTFTAVTATSLTVSWMEPTGGATAYTLERATSLAGPWTEIASDVPLRMHVDSGLSGNTSYLYRVRASNAAGALSGYSPPGSVTTPPDSAAAVPGVPGTPTFSYVTATSLRVSWTAASGATSYAVERSTSELGGWTQIAVVTATSIADGGRSANTTYWYRVRASNAGGFGAFSPASSVVTAPNVPGAPAFASVATTSISVSWAPPAGGASSYELERATSGTGPWNVVAVTDPMLVDTGLAANTTYYYRVRAKSSAGVVSAYAPTRSVTTAPDAASSVPGAPGAPTYTSVTATAVKLLWAPALGATSYEVERAAGATAPGTFSPIKTALASTAYSDFGRSPNTRYWYRVRGVGPGGKGPYSAASSILTGPGVPGAPAFALIGTTTLTVTWAAPSGGASSYKVERATSAFGPWTSIASGVPTTSFPDGGLIASTTYHYRIRATNADGLDGVVSPSRSTMTAADASTPIAGAPGTPQFTNVRATSVDLTWTAGTAATSYKVERAAAATGPFTQIASATGTTYGDAPLSANTTYWYQVRSVNAAGDGLASAAQSVMTAPNPPGVPTFAGVGATTVTVSWTAPAGGAASYAIERAPSSVGPWTELASGVTSLSHDDTALDAGMTYYYRVRASNTAGAYGGYSAVRDVTTAAAAPGM